MGISRLTALEIKTNKTRTISIGPHDNGKFGYEILLLKNNKIHKTIISVDYGYYETHDLALEGGNDLVKEICNMTQEEIFS